MRGHKSHAIAVCYDYGYEYHPNSIEVNLSPERVIAIAAKGHAELITMNRGLLRMNKELLHSSKLKAILNYNSRNPMNSEFQDIACLGDIEALGVKGVSFKLFLGSGHSNLDSFVRLAEYLNGKEIMLTGTVVVGEKLNSSTTSIENIAYGVRAAAELGYDSFMISDVFESEQLDKLLLEAYIPVWLGIRKVEGIQELLEKARDYREKGITGLVVGKSFLSMFDSPKVLEGLHKVFVGNKSVDVALKEIQTG